MITRVTMSSIRKNAAGHGVKITMFLPITFVPKIPTDRISQSPALFDPEGISGDWPCANAIWEQKAIYGHMAWDENVLQIRWTDEDITKVELRDGMAIREGSIWRFVSSIYTAPQRAPRDMTIEEVTLL